MQNLHDIVKQRLQTNKEKIINKADKLKDPEPVTTNQTIFIRTEPRKPKDFLRFKRTMVINDKNNKIWTDLGLVHKNKVIKNVKQIYLYRMTKNNILDDPNIPMLWELGTVQSGKFYRAATASLPFPKSSDTDPSRLSTSCFLRSQWYLRNIANP